MNNGKLKNICLENKIFYLVVFSGLLPIVYSFYIFNSLGWPIYWQALACSSLFLIVVGIARFARLLILNQLRASIKVMEALATDDYSMRVRSYQSKGILNELNHWLNMLAIKSSEKNQISKERQILLHKISSQIDVAILVVDELNCVSLMNPAAKKLFKFNFDQTIGRSIKNLGLQNVIDSEYKKVTEITLNGHKKKVFVHIDEYLENGSKQKLIFITDIQTLLRDEERAAWQKLLRVLSHEINNSLAPIASISETLFKLSTTSDSSDVIDDDFREGLSLIQERSNSLNEFIQNYQQLSQLPPPIKSKFDLGELIRRTLTIFEDIDFDCPSGHLLVFGDKNQLQQVLMNLIKNAGESMLNNTKRNISVEWEQSSEQIEIHIRDEGEGILNFENLFVPYYSTKESGSGIGLVLCRQIITNHGGDLTISNRDDRSGAKVTIYFPYYSV